MVCHSDVASAGECVQPPECVPVLCKRNIALYQDQWWAIRSCPGSLTDLEHRHNSPLMLSFPALSVCKRLLAPNTNENVLCESCPGVDGARAVCGRTNLGQA